MPTAPTQLVIIMTANVSWILSSRFVRPRAPTTVGRRPKAPHSPSLSSWFWPEPLTVLRLQVISCRWPSSTLGHDQQAAQFGRCEPGKNGTVGLKASLVSHGQIVKRSVPVTRGMSLTLVWRRPPQCAHVLKQLLLLAFSLPLAIPAYATQPPSALSTPFGIALILCSCFLICRSRPGLPSARNQESISVGSE